MRNSLTTAIIGAGIVLAAACGTEPEENSFAVTISGDTSFTIEGEAIFGVSVTQGREYWVIFLSRGTFGGLDFDAIAIGRHGSATPIEVGTHTIVDADSDNLDPEDIDAVYVLRRSADGSIASYGSDTGTITVTSASNDLIRGEFSFEADFELAVGSFGGVEEITISGSFTAIRGDVPSVTS